MPIDIDRLRRALAERYVIEREIGRGGMATVYLAEDLKHGRQVAVKVLEPELASSIGSERFLREIETAARLNHPHILPLYDSGEADGFLYYVMPYMEGDSLRDRLNREGQLPVEDAVRIAREVAGGLDYAHEQGVVHRDIKPGNIMLSRGHAVIADFGIAWAVSEAGGKRVTKTGISLGSPTYMSPEQASGSETLDGRSDIYALGCVLYEMLAGEPPYTGKTAAALMARKSMDAAPRLRAMRETVPPGVEQAVAKALAKVPADRFSTAGEFAAALKAAPVTPDTEPAIAESGPAQGRLRSPLVRAGLGVVVLLGLAGLYAVLQRGETEPTPSEAAAEDTIPAIAVLPFTVRGDGLDVWREGMVDLLSTNLVGVAGLRTIASSTVLARWREEVPDDRLADLATELSVAAAAGAQYAVVGRAIASGPNLRLDADLYEVEAAEILGQVKAEGSPADVLQLIDQLSLEIVRAIGSGEAVDLPKFDLAGATTESLEALKAYVRGEASFRRAEFESAVEAYETAVATDSTFVLAHYRLADTYVYAFQFGASRRASERAAQALEEARRSGRWASSDIPPALLVWVSSEDFITPAEQAVREQPGDAQLWHELGEAYMHNSNGLVEPRRGRDAFGRAIALDSGFLASYSHYIGEYLRLDPDSAHVSELIDRYEAQGASDDDLAWERVAHAIAFGDSGARAWGYAALDSLVPPFPGALARWALSHPLFLPQRAEVFRIASRRKDEIEPWFSNWLVVRTALDRGRIEEALQELAARDLRAKDGAGRQRPDAASLVLPTMYRAYSQGLPVPAGILDSILMVEVPDTVLTKDLLGDAETRTPAFYTAAYAISKGVAAAAPEAVGGLRYAAQYHHEAGDTDRANIALGAMKALVGFDAWKNQGDMEEARRLLEEVQSKDLVSEYQVNRTVRWWLAELLAESGELREATRYYESLVEGPHYGLYDPPAMYRLGQVYEQLGEVEKARHAYGFVLLAWRDADPTMQPWVDETRAALARLGDDVGQ